MRAKGTDWARALESNSLNGSFWHEAEQAILVANCRLADESLLQAPSQRRSPRLQPIALSYITLGSGFRPSISSR